MSEPVVKVTSPSFSAHPLLRKEISERFKHVILNDAGTRFAGATLAAYLADADAAIIGLERIDADILRACPRLRMVSKYGVGLDNIDADACTAHGVAIGWSGGVNRRSVSEMTLATMISLCRNIHGSALKLRQGNWDKTGGRQLTGRTVGIIGVGHVGKDLIELLTPFKCRILVNDIIDQDEYYRQHGLIPASKDEIYETAELVSLHVPLTPETRHMINAESLARFQPGAILINSCRGEVVDQRALHQALASGRLAAAALDVFEEEPPTDLDFLALPNLIATAHIGGSSNEAIIAMGRSAIEHLEKFLLEKFLKVPA